MLKTAYCYKNLGELASAREAMELLVARFPGTPAAELAREQLARLGGPR
jgi:TolA-binding protein